MNLTMGKKLVGASTIMLCLTIILGSAAIWNVDRLGNSVDTLGHRYVKMLYLTGDVNNLSSEMIALSRGMNVRGFAKDLPRIQEYNAHYESDVAKLRSDCSDILTQTDDPQIAQLVSDQILGKLDRLSETNRTLFESASKFDMPAALAVYSDKYLPLADGLSKSGQTLADRAMQLSNERAELDSAAVGPARYVSLFLMALTMLVGAGLLFIVRGINSSLADSIAELGEGADQINNAASQVASSSQSLAQGSSEQAASLEETSASSQEINSMARKNTDNSRATAELLSQSQIKVTQANEHLAEMVVSMNEINESSGKISKIIKVIDEIAFQTNILALNAAVEAARAGEAGMGFAVVADEVRSLAQRSAQAAKDTAILIEDSIARSNEGKGKVDRVATAIRAVTEDTSRVKVMVDEVSLGSEEQSRGIDQIGRAIVQMEQVTQTTAANAEESAAAAEQLSAQSETLRDIVGRLNVMVSGGAGAVVSRPRPKIGSPRVAPVSHSDAKPRKLAIATTTAKTRTPAVAEPTKVGLSVEEQFPMEESFQSF